MDVILDGMEAVPQALSDLTGAEISGTRLFATLLFGKTFISLSHLWLRSFLWRIEELPYLLAWNRKELHTGIAYKGGIG